MPPARPASAPQVFRAGPGDETEDPELARILRINDPGVAVEGILTFVPAIAISIDAWLHTWNVWCRETLRARLARHLWETALHAEQGKAAEIQALDLALGEIALPNAGESTAAGRRLVARLAACRGEKWLAKLQRGAEAGDFPLHFATAFGVQHALFHLPWRLLVPSYAYWEWHAALAARPPRGTARPKFVEGIFYGIEFDFGLAPRGPQVSHG